MEGINIKRIIWEYDISENDYLDMLFGKTRKGWFDQKWALRRAIESLNYYDLLKLVSIDTIRKYWPELRTKLRNKDVVQGLDYVIRKYTLSASK